jgi:superfamily II DNA or RNA helicase
MNRPCGPKPNKYNNAYSKEELVDIAVNDYGFEKHKAEKLDMQMLCEALNIAYVNPSIAEMSKYHECLKYQKKKDIIENNLAFFKEKGYTEEQINFTKKEKLCDILFSEDSEFVVPEDFDEKNCHLYDMPTLTRIAVRKHIDTTRYTTQPELCRAIQITYLRDKMNFNIEKNPEFVDEEKGDILTCMTPTTGNKELQQHQRRVVKHILTHRGLIAVHATGTGKTLTAVAAINCMLAKYPNIRVVIITPLSLVDNIKREIRKFGLDIENDPELYTRIEVYSYDEYVNLQRRKKSVECNNTFLIIDEAHNLRTDVNIKDTKLTKGSKSFTIMNCARTAFKVLLLTATPMLNTGFDLRNLLMMVDGTDPEKAQTQSEFMNEINGNLAYMANCKISYYDPPLDENFPSRKDETVDMYMDPEYYQKYKEIEDKYFEVINVGDKQKIKNKDFFYHNLRVAINALDKHQSPKVNWVVDFILKEAAEGRKSVVYSNWKSAGMNLIRTRLDELAEREGNDEGLYLYISGDVPSEVRKLVKKKFNSNQSKILLITRAGGEGLDLKEVRNVIIMESNWNASSDAQIIGRGIRYKSHLKLPVEDRNVTIYRLLLHKPEGNTDPLPGIDDILYKRAYEVKLPAIKEYLEIIKQNSIEAADCHCRINDSPSNPIGCQSITLLEKLKKEGKSTKTEVIYEAPSGLTAISLKVPEISKSLFRRLAGLGGVKKRVSFEGDEKKEPIKITFEDEEEIKMEDDLEMTDDFVDEHQNDLDSPGENEPPVAENVKVDDEEDEGEDNIDEKVEIEIDEDW